MARARLAEAERHRRAALDAWASAIDDDLMGAWVETAPDGSRELRCTFTLHPDVWTQVDQGMCSFLVAVREALDAAVLATAWFTAPVATYSGKSSHAMPLCDSAEEFIQLRTDGHLGGVRPDQIRVLEKLQPFQPGAFGRVMTHLREALALLETGGSLFGVWASDSDPEVHVPPGVDVVEVRVDEAGLVGDGRRIASVTISPDDDHLGVEMNPRVYFDPVLAVQPWPTDKGDMFGDRSRQLLVLARHLVSGLERSVNTFTGAGIELLAELDADNPDQVWSLIEFEDEALEVEARKAIARSDQAMAIYRADDGTLTFLRITGNHLIGRTIAAASAIEPTGVYGPAVEDAVRAEAGRWGLPDFVLRPSVVTKGSGIREISDGTIVTGSRGITLQVKSRNQGKVDTLARATNWLLKNARSGLRQGRGTIGTLTAPSITMTNLRGHDLTIDGTQLDWVPVVILDHPDPPPHVTPDHDSGGPCLVLLRSDWEFLWNQLRSATAVVDYVHRVASEEPLELGTETSRYFQLAELDANADPVPVAEWLQARGANTPTLPTLPHDPPSSSDPLGFDVFQNVLSDIAASSTALAEADRVHVLAQLDRTPVTARAELGRRLLRNLANCVQTDPGTWRFEHRLMFLDEGSLQLTFSTMSQLTAWDQERWHIWVQHRRQGFLQDSGATGPNLPWTVSVLLTPRPDGPSPWDTTVVATDAPAHFDDAEFERLDSLLQPQG